MRKNIFLLFFLVTACNQPSKTNALKTVPVAEDTSKIKLKDLDFAVKKDLSCGMPLSAGVSDTAYYKGKLYGFCSLQCKAEFLKDPEVYLSAK